MRRYSFSHLLKLTFDQSLGRHCSLVLLARRRPSRVLRPRAERERQSKGSLSRARERTQRSYTMSSSDFQKLSLSFVSFQSIPSLSAPILRHQSSATKGTHSSVIIPCTSAPPFQPLMIALIPPRTEPFGTRCHPTVPLHSSDYSIQQELPYPAVGRRRQTPPLSPTPSATGAASRRPSLSRGASTAAESSP